MLPTSSVYFIFLALVCALSWSLYKTQNARIFVLLLANVFFLAKFGLLYVAVVPLAASLDFLIGLSLDRFRQPGLRRLLVSASLVINLGMLVAVKSAPLASTDGYSWLLTLSLSFYCFQALSYTIDLYRGDAVATRSYLAHLTAASFFPVIVAGPINNLSELRQKLENPFELTRLDGARGLLLIACGLAKKLLIADFLADNLVNRVFDTPQLYSGAEVLIGVYGFAFQLYYDFSGYTDIALGVGQLLGVSLPDNFDRPYLSSSITEFWRRWHITFSNWLRDYLYMSLPSARRWKPLGYINLVITMFLGGLWHGLSWSFATWGLLHGVGLAVARVWKEWRLVTFGGLIGRIFAVLLTFHFVCLSWIFFRTPTIQSAFLIMRRVSSSTYSLDNVTRQIVVVLAVAFVGQCFPRRWFSNSTEIFARAPFYLQGAALAGMVLLIQFLSGRGAAPFVYSNF